MPKTNSKMPVRILSLFALVALFALVLGLTNWRSLTGSPEPAYAVSLVNLIASTNHYAGKRVRVSGFLVKGDQHLFLTRDHAEIMDYMSAIPLIDHTPTASQILSNCPDGYVSVTGRMVSLESSGRYHLGQIEKVLSEREPIHICYEREESAAPLSNE
ncbi:MAG: hypothetical protein MI755_07475 [Sphingomonadales bacterium]|nr:hypothetical protein [Sphingomonadales bacterium]